MKIFFYTLLTIMTAGPAFADAPPAVIVVPPEPANEKPGEAAVVFGGNAMLILKIGPFTVLTDPSFIRRGGIAEMTFGADAERLTDPAFSVDRLPHVDFVIVSHLHEDHFGPEARKKLDKNLTLLAPEDAAAELREDVFPFAYGVEPWQTVYVRKGGESLAVIGLPAKHAPGVIRPFAKDAIGVMIDYKPSQGGRRLRIYFSGDTLMGGHIEEIGRRFTGIDAAFLNLGAAKIYGLRFTMDEEEGVEALSILKPDIAFPIHYEDYDFFHFERGEFQEELQENGYQGKVVFLEPGAIRTF